MVRSLPGSLLWSCCVSHCQLCSLRGIMHAHTKIVLAKSLWGYSGSRQRTAFFHSCRKPWSNSNKDMFRSGCGMWHMARSYVSTCLFFEAAQFVFCPMLYFLQNPAEVAQPLEELLGYPLSFDQVLPEDEKNEHSHPALGEEMAPNSSTRARFDAIMANDSELLLEGLLDAHMHGAHMPRLPPYSGGTTTTEVKAWLIAGWD
mmetsp:Transcript_56521/g.127049  ORF Transcript_56521/g.127049 Transcript_56521/m.127049 type:complete len:202 (+) Transcript_56521:824-1429(+)